MLTILADHVHRHPKRLLLTVLVVVALSWSLAVWSFLRTVDAAHNGRVETCRSIDELNRELHVAWEDAGFPFIADRFEPTLNCEKLP